MSLTSCAILLMGNVPIMLSTESQQLTYLATFLYLVVQWFLLFVCKGL